MVVHKSCFTFLKLKKKKLNRLSSFQEIWVYRGYIHSKSDPTSKLIPVNATYNIITIHSESQIFTNWVVFDIDMSVIWLQLLPLKIS